jgi:hypothetical protein
MKKLVFLLSLFILTSPASATIYKWVDQQGTINFADDLAKVPPDYRGSVEEINAPRVGRSTLSQATVEKRPVTGQPGESAAKPPPIGQTLVREGDFAIKLAEVLKVGQAQSEAEAENTLASAGIAPKNGWIADYPVTPDIIGELQNVVGAAADSGKLAMKKDEAMKVFQDLVAQQGFPVRSDEGQYAGIEQPDAGVAPLQNYPEYYEPSEINNYYYNQGPPIVSYYPPPQDYDYLYAWVPYPFLYGRFWFPGFFILNDFHRPIYGRGGPCFVSNHYRDHGSHRVRTVDPVTRHNGRAFRGEGDLSHGRGFHSAEARNGAASIYGRSYERSGHGNAPNGANSTRPGGRFEPGYSANRGNSPAASNSRTRGSERPSAAWGNRGEVGLHGSGERPSSQQRGFEGHSRVPSTGGDRSLTPSSTGSRSPSRSSFRAPSVGGNRSLSPPSGRVGRSFTSPSMGSRSSYGGSFRASQGGGRSGGLGRDR